MSAKVTVELTIEQARALLYARNRVGAPDSSAAIEAFTSLARAIKEAERSPAEDGPDKDRGHRPRPEWGWIVEGPLVRTVANAVESDPSHLATADMSSALVRDLFDQIGLSPHDDETIYVASATVQFIFMSLAARHQKGGITDATFGAVVESLIVFMSGLLPYLPAEARADG